MDHINTFGSRGKCQKEMDIFDSFKNKKIYYYGILELFLYLQGYSLPEIRLYGKSNNNIHIILHTLSYKITLYTYIYLYIVCNI